MKIAKVSVPICRIPPSASACPSSEWRLEEAAHTDLYLWGTKPMMMKKYIYTLAFSLATGLMLALSACTHSNDPSPINSGTPGSGWRITSFTEPGENNTDHYTGYTFDFASGGSMTAIRNAETTNGSWNQNNNDGKPRLEINLNTTDNRLSKLNHNWVIVSKTDNEISLTDDNASSDEHLVFSK